jgi:hypothetical protein
MMVRGKMKQGTGIGLILHPAPFALLPLLLFLAGCAPAPPPAPAAKETAQKQGAVKKNNLPGRVRTRGIIILWRESTPSGGLRRVMEVQAETGTVDAETQSGTFNRARGVLYRDDKPRARYEAPVVEAAQDRSVVIARGGVTMRSIEPPGVTLTAGRITWHIAQNVIVAEGHVRVVYQPPGAPRPTAVGGADRMTINTELQKFHVP